jgi:AcrR family transcriptional regulator
MPRISDARRDSVRRRILEAAIAVFERDGFAKASMTAIALEAGLSAGGLYTHFASKEELFLSGFAALVEDEELALQNAIVSSASTAHSIELAIDYVAQVAAGANRDFRGAGGNFLLHSWATADENPSLREMLVRRRERASGLARTVLEAAISRGELSVDVDVNGLALAFTSMLDGLFLQRAERGEEFRADDGKRQAHAFVDSVFGIKADGPHPNIRKDLS